jgi:hypothetical protein
MPYDNGACRCHYGPDDFARWIAEKPMPRVPHEYRTDRDTGYVLVCKQCNGLWDHRVTDRLFEFIQTDAFRRKQTTPIAA